MKIYLPTKDAPKQEKEEAKEEEKEVIQSLI